MYRRRRGIGACGCPAWHFPHRHGSCATGHRRAVALLPGVAQVIANKGLYELESGATSAAIADLRAKAERAAASIKSQIKEDAQ